MFPFPFVCSHALKGVIITMKHTKKRHNQILVLAVLLDSVAEKGFEINFRHAVFIWVSLTGRAVRS